MNATHTPAGKADLAERHRDRFLGYLRSGTAGRTIEGKAISADIVAGSGGAYTLPRLLADAIGQAIAPAHAIPGLVSRATAAGETWSEPMGDAPRAHWLADGPDGDEAPVVSNVVPIFGELVVSFEASRAVMADAGFDLESWFVEIAGRAFAESEARAFLAGSGVGRPSGLVDEITITPASGDLATALKALRDSVPVAARAHWVMPSAIADRLDGLAAYAAADNHGPARLHGIPVMIDEACTRPAAPAVMDGETVVTPAAPAAGLVLLGDLGQAYRAVEVLPKGSASAIECMLDPYTRNGFVQVRVSKRVGGAVRDAGAVRGIEVALP